MKNIADIETNQIKDSESSGTSFLSKKNALIAIGVLAAIGASVIILAYSQGWYLSSPPATNSGATESPTESLTQTGAGAGTRTGTNTETGSGSRTEPYEGSNLILFTNGNSIYSLDPGTEPLNASAVYSQEEILFPGAFNPNNRIHQDEEYVYYQDITKAIKKVLITGGSSVELLNGTGLQTGFCLDKPTSKGIYFQEEEAANALKYFNFEAEQREDHKSLICPEGGSAKILLKSNDGTKFLYRCYTRGLIGTVYFRNGTNLEPDGLINFYLPSRATFKFSADDKYAITITDRSNSLTILNFTDNHQLTTKIVNLNFNWGNNLTASFSKDGNTLYVLSEVTGNLAGEFQLYEINFKGMREASQGLQNAVSFISTEDSAQYIKSPRSIIIPEINKIKE